MSQKEETTGWINLTHAEYDAHPGIRSSHIKPLIQSPLHYQAAQESQLDEEQTDAQRLGAVIHGCVFEPELFLPRLLVCPKYNKSTIKGKEGYAEFLSLAPEHSLILSKKEEELVLAITDAIRSHARCQSYFKNGVGEVAGIARDHHGILRKIKPDFRRTDCGVIFDLKTTTNALLRSFRYDAFNLGYFTSAAYYLDTANIIEPGRYEAFVWVAVEKKKPWAIKFYQLSPERHKEASEQIEDAMQKLLIAKETNVWSGYPDEIEYL